MTQPNVDFVRNDMAGDHQEELVHSGAVIKVLQPVCLPLQADCKLYRVRLPALPAVCVITDRR